MTDKPELVIDGDGHVIEVDATYERIDPKYRERRPRYTQAGRGYIVRLVDGKVWGPETDIGFVGVNGNLPPPKGKAIHYRRMGTYNPWARLSDMDKDQLDVAVIYPTDELPLTVTLDGGFAAARARAVPAAEDRVPGGRGGVGAVLDAPHGRVQRGRPRAMGAHLGEAERVRQERSRVLFVRAGRRVHPVLHRPRRRGRDAVRLGLSALRRAVRR